MIVVLVAVASAVVLAVAGAIRSRRAGHGRAAALAELSGAFDRLFDAPAGKGPENGFGVQATVEPVVPG